MKPNLTRRQFARNLTANLVGLAIGVVASLVLTPYWIKELGVAAFGLVPLTNNLVAYFGLVAAVLSSSISRFITIEVARGNVERASRVFNTSLLASCALAAVVLLAGIGASFRAESLISVPAGYGADSQLLLILATATFAISLIQTPFGVATFLANRLDVNVWVSVGMRALQILVSVFLVATVYRRPSALVVGSLLGALVSAMASIHYWRKWMPWSRIAWRMDRDILVEQLSFGGWSVVNQLGSLLYLQIDLIVINRLLGPEPAGQYAALAQWSFLIRSLGGTLSGVLVPTILYLYARNDIQGLIDYARRSVLALGLLLALPIGLIAGLAGPLLALWLGADYAQFESLLAVMVLPLCINVAVSPLFSVQAAANRVKAPAIVTCAMGAGNVLLAIALTRWLGMMGVALAGAIMLTAKNAIFTPAFTALALGRGWSTFVRDMLRTTLLACLVAAGSLAAARWFALTTAWRLALAGLTMAAVYVPVVWWAVLSSAERRQVRQQVLGPALARARSVIRGEDA